MAFSSPYYKTQQQHLQSAQLTYASSNPTNGVSALLRLQPILSRTTPASSTLPPLSSSSATASSSFVSPYLSSAAGNGVPRLRLTLLPKLDSGIHHQNNGHGGTRGGGKNRKEDNHSHNKQQQQQQHLSPTNHKPNTMMSASSSIANMEFFQTYSTSSPNPHAHRRHRHGRKSRSPKTKRASPPPPNISPAHAFSTSTIPPIVPVEAFRPIAYSVNTYVHTHPVPPPRPPPSSMNDVSSGTQQQQKWGRSRFPVASVQVAVKKKNESGSSEEEKTSSLSSLPPLISPPRCSDATRSSVVSYLSDPVRCKLFTDDAQEIRTNGMTLDQLVEMGAKLVEDEEGDGEQEETEEKTQEEQQQPVTNGKHTNKEDASAAEEEEKTSATSSSLQPSPPTSTAPPPSSSSSTHRRRSHHTTNTTNTNKQVTKSNKLNKHKHPTESRSVHSLLTSLQKLDELGYRFISLSDLLDHLQSQIDMQQSLKILYPSSQDKSKRRMFLLLFEYLNSEECELFSQTHETVNASTKGIEELMDAAASVSDMTNGADESDSSTDVSNESTALSILIHLDHSHCTFSSFPDLVSAVREEALRRDAERKRKKEKEKRVKVEKERRREKVKGYFEKKGNEISSSLNDDTLPTTSTTSTTTFMHLLPLKQVEVDRLIQVALESRPGMKKKKSSEEDASDNVNVSGSGGGEELTDELLYLLDLIEQESRETNHTTEPLSDFPSLLQALRAMYDRVDSFQGEMMEWMNTNNNNKDGLFSSSEQELRGEAHEITQGQTKRRKEMKGLDYTSSSYPSSSSESSQTSPPPSFTLTLPLISHIFLHAQTGFSTIEFMQAFVVQQEQQQSEQQEQQQEQAENQQQQQPQKKKFSSIHELISELRAYPEVLRQKKRAAEEEEEMRRRVKEEQAEAEARALAAEQEEAKRRQAEEAAAAAEAQRILKEIAEAEALKQKKQQQAEEEQERIILIQSLARGRKARAQVEAAKVAAAAVAAAVKAAVAARIRQEEAKAAAEAVAAAELRKQQEADRIAAEEAEKAAAAAVAEAESDRRLFFIATLTPLPLSPEEELELKEEKERRNDAASVLATLGGLGKILDDVKMMKREVKEDEKEKERVVEKKVEKKNSKPKMNGYSSSFQPSLQSSHHDHQHHLPPLPLSDSLRLCSLLSRTINLDITSAEDLNLIAFVCGGARGSIVILRKWKDEEMKMILEEYDLTLPLVFDECGVERACSILQKWSAHQHQEQSSAHASPASSFTNLAQIVTAMEEEIEARIAAEEEQVTDFWKVIGHQEEDDDTEVSAVKEEAAVVVAEVPADARNGITHDQPAPIKNGSSRNEVDSHPGTDNKSSSHVSNNTSKKDLPTQHQGKQKQSRVAESDEQKGDAPSSATVIPVSTSKGVDGDEEMRAPIEADERPTHAASKHIHAPTVQQDDAPTTATAAAVAVDAPRADNQEEVPVPLKGKQKVAFVPTEQKDPASTAAPTTTAAPAVVPVPTSQVDLISSLSSFSRAVATKLPQEPDDDTSLLQSFSSSFALAKTVNLPQDDADDEEKKEEKKNTTNEAALASDDLFDDALEDLPDDVIDAPAPATMDDKQPTSGLRSMSSRTALNHAITTELPVDEESDSANKDHEVVNTTTTTEKIVEAAPVQEEVTAPQVVPSVPTENHAALRSYTSSFTAARRTQLPDDDIGEEAQAVNIEAQVAHPVEVAPIETPAAEAVTAAVVATENVTPAASAPIEIKTHTLSSKAVSFAEALRTQLPEDDQAMEVEEKSNTVSSSADARESTNVSAPSPPAPLLRSYTSSFTHALKTELPSEEMEDENQEQATKSETAIPPEEVLTVPAVRTEEAVIPTTTAVPTENHSSLRTYTSSFGNAVRTELPEDDVNSSGVDEKSATNTTTEEAVSIDSQLPPHDKNHSQLRSYTSSFKHALVTELPSDDSNDEIETSGSTESETVHVKDDAPVAATPTPAVPIESHALRSYTSSFVVAINANLPEDDVQTVEVEQSTLTATTTTDISAVVPLVPEKQSQLRSYSSSFKDAVKTELPIDENNAIEKESHTKSETILPIEKESVANTEEDIVPTVAAVPVTADHSLRSYTSSFNYAVRTELPLDDDSELALANTKITLTEQEEKAPIEAKAIELPTKDPEVEVMNGVHHEEIISTVPSVELVALTPVKAQPKRRIRFYQGEFVDDDEEAAPSASVDIPQEAAVPTQQEVQEPAAITSNGSTHDQQQVRSFFSTILAQAKPLPTEESKEEVGHADTSASTKATEQATVPSESIKTLVADQTPAPISEAVIVPITVADPPIPPQDELELDLELPEFDD